MVDPHVGHETSDLAGQSQPFNGSLTDTYNDTRLEVSPSRVISEFLVENDKDSDGNLQVSINGTDLFKTVCPGGWLIWSPKGFIRTVYLKRQSGSSVTFEATVNFEDF